MGWAPCGAPQLFGANPSPILVLEATSKWRHNPEVSGRRYTETMRAIFWILGIFNTANGVWMLLAPRAWYYGLPARVSDTGPLNGHFVRDIGAAFLTLGIAFCFTAPRASRHRGVVLAAAVFYTLHGLIHVFDLASGRLDAHHWLIDLPGVFLPAAVLVVLCAPRWWSKEA